MVAESYSFVGPIIELSFVAETHPLQCKVGLIVRVLRSSRDATMSWDVAGEADPN